MRPVHDQIVGDESRVRPSLRSLIAMRHQARGLSLQRVRRSSSHHSGANQAAVRGRGMDFAEVRTYAAGDEIRHMDWRVTARTNEPHIKLFQEERERPVYILVDMRSSMYFGTRGVFKSVMAAQAAALLAWATADNGDRVGGVICTDQQVTELAPQSRRRGVLPLLSALAEHAPLALDLDTSTSLLPSLKRLARIARPGSLVFLLSDYTGFDAEVRQAIQQLLPHREVISGFIYDPLEAHAPKPGVYQFTNGQETVTCNTALQQTRIAYHQQFEQRHAALKALHMQYGMGWFELVTNETALAGMRQGLSR